jgi:DNA-binding CsgD family transcriptional regulator
MVSTDLLSRREQDVAELLMQGKSNKQMAVSLGISEHTVEFHLKNIYAKLGVSSRVEAILSLGKSTGVFEGKLGESSVNAAVESTDNGVEPALQAAPLGIDVRKKSWVALIAVVLILGMVLLAIAVGIRLEGQAVWEGYERECEKPDGSTVGQAMTRSFASGSLVHGQFGTAGEAPWPAVAGYVTYENIRIPHSGRLYLLLRYSKDSPSETPVTITLDDELYPRSRITLLDLHDWEQFAWTVPIDLGEVSRGTHAIRLSTEGQPYGVADLDKFRLTDQKP